jgi:hypothetical protein
MSIDIKGKKYYTVADRINKAHEDGNLLSVKTEFLPISDMVVCKATIEIKSGDVTKVFTGTSAANPAKLIEKLNPYEVSETSAVGRALAFAGFLSSDDIASYDEMQYKSSDPAPIVNKPAPVVNNGTTDNNYYSDKKLNEAQLKLLFVVMKNKGITKEQVYEKFNVTSLTDLTTYQLNLLLRK